MNTLPIVAVVSILILYLIYVMKNRSKNGTVHRTTVILFYAEWCGACTAVKPTWDEVKGDMSDKLNFEEVNIDDAAAVAAKEKVVGETVNSVPTIFVVQGMIVEKYEGPRTREQFSAYLESKC